MPIECRRGFHALHPYSLLPPQAAPPLGVILFVIVLSYVRGPGIREIVMRNHCDVGHWLPTVSAAAGEESMPVLLSHDSGSAGGVGLVGKVLMGLAQCYRPPEPRAKLASRTG